VVTRLLLVEDVIELRSVLRQVLTLRAGLEVVGEAGDGASAVEAATRLQPDVVVLDLGLPDVTGHEVMPRIRAVSPATQIVVYTGSYTAEEIAGAAEHIAMYVGKDRDAAYLADLLANLHRTPYDTDSVGLGPDPGDVAVARRFVTDRCRRWGCGDVVDDAELVVSELVTNALVHAGTRCELRIGLSGTALRVQVTDGADGVPDPQSATGGDEHGRGLLLVGLLCAAWGTEPLAGGGKVVWAEMLRRGADDSDDMLRMEPAPN
jgi:CheY-like chemotaxis protein/anti-sigma regulatory factor (Ser/Thr protein kinase)